MKILHLADLHLGKKIKGWDLIEDQEYVLKQAVRTAVEEKADAVVIAGDVYDTKLPGEEATNLLDRFVTSLYEKKIPLLMIPGNHDSADKLHFASSILAKNGIHIVTSLKDGLRPLKIVDANFYLLPYFRYQDVNAEFQEERKEPCASLLEAAEFLVKKMNIDPSETNVLVLHQSVLPADGHLSVSGSEVQPEVNDLGEVGGSDTLPCSLFKDFDYVALGHIHKTLNVSKNARYPGALLKYHKDEANAKKAFTLVETKKKNVTVKEIPYRLLHDAVVMKGTFASFLNKNSHADDYVFFEAEDELPIEEGMAKLKAYYSRPCELIYPGFFSKYSVREETEDVKKISPLELFGKFYQKMIGKEMDEEETALVKEELAKVGKEKA